MKLKHYIIAIFAVTLLFPTIVQAQGRFDAYAMAGLNMGQIDGDGAGSYNHPGLRAGVGTSFAIDDDSDSPWRMVIELAFTQKGSFVKQYNRTLSAGYVEIPLMLSYNLMDNRLRLAAGVAPAILVQAKVENGGELDRPSTENFKRMDWLPVTCELRYRFTDHLGIDLRWQNSMLSVTKENSSGTYRIFRSNKGAFNRLVTFGLTYQF